MGQELKELGIAANGNTHQKASPQPKAGGGEDRETRLKKNENRLDGRFKKKR